jgi:hypothetical protein
MDLTEGSETSGKLNLTPGKYPKENLQVSKHGENLKPEITQSVCVLSSSHKQFSPKQNSYKYTKTKILISRMKKNLGLSSSSCHGVTQNYKNYRMLK